MNTVGLQNILDDFLEEHCSFYAQAHQVNHAWITQKKKLIYMPAGNGYWSRWFLQGGFCRKIQRRRPQPMCNKEVNVVHGHCPCRACNSPSSLLVTWMSSYSDTLGPRKRSLTHSPTYQDLS